MTNGSGSSKCGCGSSDANKNKDPCPKARDKKSGFSKTPCKQPKGKGTCHESHEQFKNKGSDCSSSSDKCSSSYQEFTKGMGERACGGGGLEAHSQCADAYKRVQESKVTEDCSDNPQEKLDDCSNAYRKFQGSKLDDCSQARERIVENQQLKSETCSACPPQLKTKQPCSGTSEDKAQSCRKFQETKTSSQASAGGLQCSSQTSAKSVQCSKKLDKPKDETVYSKFASRCKSLAKDFVKSNTKCSGVEESKESSCKTTSPPTTTPCPPTAEKGAAPPVTSCSTKYSCSEVKPPSWETFFPLDARNRKLNECIEKQTKIDPSRVIEKCSQFAKSPLDPSERCLQQARSSQQKCRPGAGIRSAEQPKRLTPLVSPRTMTLMKNWAPSAGAFLAASALFGFYVTEWKAVPFVYQDNQGTSP